MDNLDDDATPDTETVGEADSFAQHARRRAETEREVVEWAIEALGRVIDEQGVDLAPLLEYGRRSQESLPDRHLEAYETMCDVFDVDSTIYDVYVFAYSKLCEELADGVGRSEQHPEGCTNVLVAPEKLALGGGVDGRDDDSGPLVLKNRDIAGRGARPKSVIEQPSIDDYYGFLTVDTCGTVAAFKGVNDRGLVAANTEIDRERDDVDPEDKLRNGTLLRMLLEERPSVDAARDFLESYPTRRLSGQTLFLADATDTVMLEIDPVAERIHVDDDDVVIRTNHFVNGESVQTESSKKRRERALELLESVDLVGRENLWTFAQDHVNGPGDDSICRHPEPDVDEPHAFGQLTTASTALFEGGSPAIEVGIGNPCKTKLTRCALGGEIPTDLRTGQRWFDRLH